MKLGKVAGRRRIGCRHLRRGRMHPPWIEADSDKDVVGLTKTSVHQRPGLNPNCISLGDILFGILIRLWLKPAKIT